MCSQKHEVLLKIEKSGCQVFGSVILWTKINNLFTSLVLHFKIYSEYKEYFFGMQHMHTVSAGIKLYIDVVGSVNFYEFIIENPSNFTKHCFARNTDYCSEIQRVFFFLTRRWREILCWNIQVFPMPKKNFRSPQLILSKLLVSYKCGLLILTVIISPEI